MQKHKCVVGCSAVCGQEPGASSGYLNCRPPVCILEKFSLLGGSKIILSTLESPKQSLLLYQTFACPDGRICITVKWLECEFLFRGVCFGATRYAAHKTSRCLIHSNISHVWTASHQKRLGLLISNPDSYRSSSRHSPTALRSNHSVLKLVSTVLEDVTTQSRLLAIILQQKCRMAPLSAI